MRAPVLSSILRRALLAAPWAAPVSSAQLAAAAGTPASIAGLASRGAAASRGFAVAASTSGRFGCSTVPGWRGVGVTTPPPLTRAIATNNTLPSPLASANPVAALKARLMPATGRNQFRRKWRKQAEIKANHRRRLHQEALARARKAGERKRRWAGAAARASGSVAAVEGGGAAAVVTTAA